MSARSCLTIVLAAGEGTRMRSALPKVLHEVAGRTLLAHVLAAVREAASSSVAVVVGPDHDAVAAEAKRVLPGADIAVQRERRGTADAVLAAAEMIARGFDDILVIFADTPFIRPETLQQLRQALANGAAIAVLGFRPKDPSGYGRLIVHNGELVAIREEKDASASERAIDLCNGGLMALSGQRALAILRQIRNDNAKGEFYLTDAVAIAREMKLGTVAIEVGEDEVSGINTNAALADGEAIMQAKLRKAALEAGVTMIAPETVFLQADTTFGKDVVIEPFVVFGPGVSIADKAVIHSFSHLSGAQVGEGASIGPYARLRPGTRIGKGARVGNFVELKEAVMEDGAKANHLTYLGDARVGEGANVGAGTITCNYDGVAKHRTDIGKGAFIGSNSALVAPVKIGDGAYVGSGSVITSDVPPDALGLGRVRQTIKEGWASRLRELKGAGKKKPAK
jgi:bifunctional UDP-N-acetylglucosamine pyrophosphorylase/glucosamine-1-phosphate N-acetyltransferase